MQSFIEDPRVAVVREASRYPSDAPYAPSEAMPEWPGMALGTEDNSAYRAVRQLLLTWGCDKENQNTPAWNPLGDFVKPGNKVILKPNFVCHRNQGERLYGITDTLGLVTHGSVVRVVVDYVAKALNGSGTIVIGDCPLQGTNWPALVKLVGLQELVEYAQKNFPGIQVVARDYRLGRAHVVNDVVKQRVVDESNLEEYVELDLQSDSLLLPLMSNGYEFGVSQYAKHRMRAAHTPLVNKYLIHRDFVTADVMINLPKMKSHMKAGITCALKNFVGINGHKDYLPHFRFGSPSQGGDEYPDGNWLWHLGWYFAHRDWEMETGWNKYLFGRMSSLCHQFQRRLGADPAKAAMNGGGWHGNDTLWRTILDVNRAFFYYDRETKGMGQQPSKQIRYLAILDGLVGGHKESPLSPTPLNAGFMLAAQNPLALDTVAAALMGLDWRLLRQLAKGFDIASRPLVTYAPEQIEILGNLGIQRVQEIYDQELFKRFEASYGYRGHVEYQSIIALSKRVEKA